MLRRSEGEDVSSPTFPALGKLLVWADPRLIGRGSEVNVSVFIAQALHGGTGRESSGEEQN